MSKPTDLVWVSLGVGKDRRQGLPRFHLDAACGIGGAKIDRRIPTIRAAAERIGLRACSYCVAKQAEREVA